MHLTNSQLLKGNRNFRNLLTGQYVSELGNWFNFVAGLGLVRELSGGQVDAAAILLICRTLPWALLMPVVGTLVDRLSRRNVMLVTDLARVLVALVFILANDANDLWIVYAGSIVLSLLAAFFDGAKTAATPNIVGSNGLLAGTALMFSSRFLLMAVGSALGGAAAAFFGYKAAFIINAASFLVSAYSVWLVPEEATRETEYNKANRKSFMDEMREGVGYVFRVPFVMTIVLMNFIWAVGGGAVNLIAERLGGVSFAQKENWHPDMAVAIIFFASGAGLFLGTMAARRVGTFLELNKITSPFIGWTLIIHGVLFGIAGYMPSLLLVAFLFLISRLIVGVEYAVQETLFQRTLPDYIRGRISTLDRGVEITVFSISTFFSTIALKYISIEMLTLVSGLISASSGILWFWRMRGREESSLGKSEEVLSDA